MALDRRFVGYGSPSAGDKWLAAASHLGAPLDGPLLPLAIFFTSRGKRFRQRHAARAFTFQCVFILCWIVLVGLMAAGTIDALVLGAVLVGAVVLELPNVVQALRGRPPMHILSGTILPTGEDR